jgi:predicted HTH domain antitoxin
MSVGQETSSSVTIELPNGFPSRIGETPEAFAREFRLAAAIEWYREGRISQGKAAELAGLGRWEFIEALGRAKVNVIHEEVLLDDVEQAVRSDRDLSSERADDAERHYKAMRSWKQPEAGRREARVFWISSEEEGARWLARRLRDESQVEALHAAVSTLTAMGEVAIGPAVEALSDDPSPDQALTLLKALGWIGESGTHPTLGGAQAELVLADFLQHDDPDIRESAAYAMRLLRPERAERWLNHRLRDEKSPEVVEAIEGELSRHSTRRA